MDTPTSPEVPLGGAARPIGVTENDIKQRSQELGLIGKVFGSREHAPINIAGAIMVLAILVMFAVPFLPEAQGFSKGDMEKTFGGILLAALTFLGGYLGGGK